MKKSKELVTKYDMNQFTTQGLIYFSARNL